MPTFNIPSPSQTLLFTVAVITETETASDVGTKLFLISSVTTNGFLGFFSDFVLFSDTIASILSITNC